MAYGIAVTNGDGRVIINSDQGFPNTKVGTPTTVTSTESSVATFPSAGTDLVFARPNSTSAVTYGAAVTKGVFFSNPVNNRLQREWMTNNSSFDYPGPGSYKTTTASLHTSPSTPSEYGLQVFASDGTSTLLMTEGFENAFEVLYSGTVSSRITNFTGINWRTDPNVYVLMNNTLHIYSAVFSTSYQWFAGYVFSSTGALSYRQEYRAGQGSPVFYGQISGSDYLVVRIKT
jgi:hypothetical protein